MSRTPLTAEELAELALTLPAWEIAPTELVRSATFLDFAAAFAFVTQVALVAQRLDHHPDIDVRYNEVNLRLSTHTAHAATGMDVKLAIAIESALTR